MNQNSQTNEDGDKPCVRHPGGEAHVVWPGTALALIGAALLFSGCRVTPPIIGLHPLAPPVTFGKESFWQSRPPRILFEDVDSVLPQLKWEAFPGERDLAADKQGRLKGLGAVTYDLRIWEAFIDGSKSELVYEREGLPQPEHRVETPLRVGTHYCWTVRARFTLDGRPRVTPWAFAQIPVPPGLLHYPQRIEEQSPEGYFSFVTP